MKNARKGFTLVELTVSIVIFSILIVISMFSYRRFVKDAMISEGKMLASSIAKIQKLYHAESGDYHAIAETSYSTVPEMDARMNKYFRTFSVEVPGKYPNSIFTVITKSENNILAGVEIVLHAFNNSSNMILLDNALPISSSDNSQNTDAGATVDGSDNNNGNGQEKNGNNGNGNGNNGNGNGNGNTADGDDNNKGNGQEKHNNL